MNLEHNENHECNLLRNNKIPIIHLNHSNSGINKVTTNNQPVAVIVFFHFVFNNKPPQAHAMSPKRDMSLLIVDAPYSVA